MSLEQPNNQNNDNEAEFGSQESLDKYFQSKPFKENLMEAIEEYIAETAPQLDDKGILNVIEQWALHLSGEDQQAIIKIIENLKNK